MRDCPNCIDKTTQGFTLIELLVVVTIIGVISAVGLASLTGVRGKTQDTVRKNDLRTLATALELYFQKNGEYLVDTDICPQTTNILYENSNNNNFDDLISGNLPLDPKTGAKYCYETDSEGLNYKLIAKLDDNTDHILTSEDYIAEARTTPTPTATASPTAIPTRTPRPARTPRPTATPIDCTNSLLINNQPIGSDRFGPTSFQAYSGNSYSIKGIYQGRFSLKVTSPNTDLGDFENSGIAVWNTNPNDIDEPHEVQLIDQRNEIICRRNVNVKKQNLFDTNLECRSATWDRAMNVYVSTYKDNNFDPNTWPVYNFMGCQEAPPPDLVVSIPSFIAEAKDKFQSVLGISTNKELLAVANTCSNPSENSSNCCGTTSLQGKTLTCSNYCQLGGGNPSSLAFGSPTQSLKNAIVHLDSSNCGFRYTKVVGDNPRVTFDNVPAALNIRGSVQIHQYNVWVEAPNNEQFTRSLCYTAGKDDPGVSIIKTPGSDSCIIKGDTRRNAADVAGHAYKGYK